MSLQLNKDSTFSYMLLMFLCLFMLYSPGRADPLFTICPVVSNYTSNSPFESNLKQLLQSLPSKTSPTGYYNTSVGNSPDQVHGLALCRGDVTSNDCGNCIKKATEGILKFCSNGREATIFYEVCEVRYSYQNFFSMMVYIGKYPPLKNSSQNVSDPTTFAEALKDLLETLYRKAVDDAKSMFSTGEVDITGKNKIYGLAQCTKDITPGTCGECLTHIIGDIIGCCSQRQAGIVLSPSCSMRFGLNQFYRAETAGKGKRLGPGSMNKGRQSQWPEYLYSCIRILYIQNQSQASEAEVPVADGLMRRMEVIDKETLLSGPFNGATLG